MPESKQLPHEVLYEVVDGAEVEVEVVGAGLLAEVVHLEVYVIEVPVVLAVQVARLVPFFDWTLRLLLVWDTSHVTI